MTFSIPWRRGWLEILAQSLRLALLLPMVLGLFYPLFLLWPEVLSGFFTHRPEFIGRLLPFALAAMNLYLLGSWRWFLKHRQAKHPNWYAPLELQAVMVTLGSLLAAQAFPLALPAGFKLASLAYGAALFVWALVWLAWPLRQEPRQARQALRSPWLLLWALLQSLALLLIFSPLGLAGMGFMLLGLIVLPLAVVPWLPDEPAELPTGRPWSWLRLAGLGASGLLVLGGCYLWLSQDLVDQHRQLLQQTLSQRERLLLRRPVLRGTPVAGNGFENYWSLIGNDCNLQGRQVPVSVSSLDSDRIRTMFDLQTGVLVPDPELLQRYASHLDLLQLAAQHRFMQYAFPGYLRRCLEEMPVPNVGSMQDLLLLQIARGLASCNAGACAAGTRQILDAARVMQDLPVYGQVVPMMVAYKLERILVSSLGTRLHPDSLTIAEWRGLLREWRSLLTAEQGLFPAVLAQEMLLAQESMLDIVPDNSEALPDNLLGYPIQLAVYPYLLQGLPELRILMAEAQNYLDKPVHDPASWSVLIEHQKSLSRRNPFANNVLIDVVLTVQRYREHQVILRGFYQHLALQAYFADKGHYPQSLEELVPAWLPSLPQDPYTGKNFSYRQSPAGFMLYSLGENQRDDGGDGFYGHFMHSDSCTGQELVFAPISPERCRRN